MFVKGMAKPANGGRRKGTPNKTTLAKAEARQAVARAEGQRLGIEVMREVMNRYLAIAARYQPIKDGAPNSDYDEKKYLHALEKAGSFGDKLAPYETPRLQSTTLRTDTPSQEPLKVELTIVHSKPV